MASSWEVVTRWPWVLFCLGPSGGGQEQGGRKGIGYEAAHLRSRPWDADPPSALVGIENTQEACVTGALLTVGSVSIGPCSLGGRGCFVIRTGVTCVGLRQSSRIGLLMLGVMVMVVVMLSLVDWTALFWADDTIRGL